MYSNIHPMTTRSKENIFKPKVYNTVLTHKEPEIVQEALNDFRRVQAMQNEYNALINNGTWSQVLRKADYKLIGNKWVYRVKYNIVGVWPSIKLD